MEVGSYVYDGDSGNQKQAIVISKPGVSAENWEVNEEETVLDKNPDYPAEDEVVIVVFVEDLDEWWDDWREYTPDDFFKEIKQRGHKFYAFPESRLEEKDINKRKLDKIYRVLKKEGYNDIEIREEVVVINKFGESIVSPDGEVSGDSSIKNSIKKVMERHSI